MKNQKGITLIALVVTIIVLLILAGISIAMLTGDNGIITRTNTSKMSQIEGQVKEEIKLAVQSAKIFAMQTSIETQGGGWFAAENDTPNTTNGEIKQVVAEMKKDLKGTGTLSGTGADALEGYEVTSTSTDAVPADNTTTPPTAAVPAKSTITVNYKTDAYEEATNYENAKIVAEIEVVGNDFEIKSITRYRSTAAADIVDYK